jgi:hypothetical protein
MTATAFAFMPSRFRIVWTWYGRERAKARGVKFGRPRKLDAHQRREAFGRIDAGETLARRFASTQRPLSA